MSDPLKSEDHTEEKSHPLVEEVSDNTQVVLFKHTRSHQSILWMFTTFILAFLLLPGAIRDYVDDNQDLSQHYKYEYETGFETDWRPAREAIRLKKVKFWGGIQFDGNEDRFLTVSPDEHTYISPPSDDIDDAWYALAHNVTIAVSPEEAKEVSDRSAFDKFRGHYTIGVGVLHSLHFLNAMRISRNVEHYRDKGYPEEWWAQFHIDHCINHLRQVIMCHGDLSPTPLIPASKKPENKG